MALAGISAAPAAAAAFVYYMGLAAILRREVNEEDRALRGRASGSMARKKKRAGLSGANLTAVTASGSPILTRV